MPERDRAHLFRGRHVCHRVARYQTVRDLVKRPGAGRRCAVRTAAQPSGTDLPGVSGARTRFPHVAPVTHMADRTSPLADRSTPR
jgi:hypothetical protein